MQKYGEYAARYQMRFQKQANQVATDLSRAYAENPKVGDPLGSDAKIAQAGGAEFHDAWGTSLTFEPARWDLRKHITCVRSAGPDRQLNTGDDLQAFVQFHRRKVLGHPPGTTIDVNIEHDRGPFNGLAEIVGTVTDSTGAVVKGASVEAREVSTGGTLHAITSSTGQFNCQACPRVSTKFTCPSAGFKIAAQKLTLQARDRAVLSAALSVGESSQVVEVTEQVHSSRPRVRLLLKLLVSRAACAVAWVGVCFASAGRPERKKCRSMRRNVMDMAADQWTSHQGRLRRVRRARALLFPRGALHQSGNHHR